MRFALLLVLLLTSLPALAEPLRVAVASNFLAPAQALAKRYESETGQQVKISAGSTGKLYAQIVNGAPYDLFLAANDREPELLESLGLTVDGSRFTYALGRLVLWSRKHQLADGAHWLQQGKYRRLSMANPRTAPYGAAALEVLHTLDLGDLWPTRLVRGENVGQSFQYAASGNTDAGFVALSQVKALGAGSYWEVPVDSYTAIRQQAVWLRRSSDRPEAGAFLHWMRSAKVEAVIREFGYGVEDSHDA